MKDEGLERWTFKNAAPASAGTASFTYPAEIAYFAITLAISNTLLE
jgi:hypothetical protein